MSPAFRLRCLIACVGSISLSSSAWLPVASAQAVPPEDQEIEEPSDEPAEDDEAEGSGATDDSDVIPDDGAEPSPPEENSLPPIVPTKKPPPTKLAPKPEVRPGPKKVESPEHVFHPDFERLPRLETLDVEMKSRAKALSSGDQTSAGLHLDNVLRLHSELGARNYQVASLLLMSEARVALDEKDTVTGLKLLAAASKLSPDLPVTHWRLAAARFEHDTDIGGYFASAMDAVRAQLRDFESSLNLLLVLSAVLIASLCLVTVGFVLIQATKYARYLGHDLSRMIPGVSGLQAAILGGIAWSLPIVFGLGWVSAAVLYLLVLGLYQNKSERRASGLVALGVVTIAALVYARTPLILYGDSEVRALYEVATRVDAPGAEARLAASSEQPEVMFLLGMRARSRGDLVSAERWLRKAREAAPADFAATNNLGTVLYLMRKPEEAQSLFEEASRVATRAEPSLNRASMLLDQNKFDEADRAFQDAARFDPELAALYKSEKSGLSTASKLLDMPFDTKRLWSPLFEGSDPERRFALAAEQWSVLDRGSPPFWSAGFAGLLALLLFVGSRVRFPTSSPCERCGEPSTEREDEVHCQTCRKIFFELSVPDPELRENKERQIRRHRRARRWQERLWSLIAGGADILDDSPILGVFLLSIVALAAASAWMPDQAQLVSWGADAGPRMIRLGLAATVALLFTLVSLRRGFDR